jgi:hypothetical protein
VPTIAHLPLHALASCGALSSHVSLCCSACRNWGLITYGNGALLWNPATDNIAQLQWVAVVIAHELAHQWFGQAPESPFSHSRLPPRTLHC